MVYEKSGVDSQEMTCGEYLEMEYVIASLKKYCSSWVGRIFIVGSEPPERVKKDVIHIPCDNPYTHCKDANIIHKLRYACENIFDLTDDFLMVSDDQIVTKVSSWEDMKPRIVIKFDDWSIDRWNKWIEGKKDVWFKYLYNTLKLFLNTLYMISETDKNLDFITAVFKLRLLKILGFMPNIRECTECKTKENITHFSIMDNGFKCKACSRQDTGAIEISEPTICISSPSSGVK